MRALLVVGGLFGVLVLVASLWLSASRTRTGAGLASGDEAGRSAGTPVELAPARVDESAREAAPAEAAAQVVTPVLPPPAAGVALEERPRGALAVEVREADGRAVAGAALELASFTGPAPRELAFEDERGLRVSALTDADGAASFADVPAGPYSLRAEGPEGRTASKTLSHSARPGAEPIRLVLPEKAPSFQVRVVDGRGAPVPGARVEVAGALAGAAIDAAAVTDELGLARFGFELLAAQVVATAADGRTGMARLDSRERIEAAMRRGGLEVVLGAAGALEGAVVGVAPAALTEARVVAWALSSDSPYNRTYGRKRETPVAGGRYRFEGLAAGKWTLALVDPAGARLVLPRMKWGEPEVPNSVDPLEVEIVPGETVLRDLVVTTGGTLAGLVRRPDGSPVAGASVCVTYTPRTSNFPDGFYVRDVNVWRYDSDVRVEGKHPVTHPSTSTDAAGRYRLAGLFPGVQRVEVFAPGLAYDRRENVEVKDGEVTALEHVLAEAGAIQGFEPENGYLGVTRQGEERARMLALLPSSGSFAFPGLEAGTYVLARFHTSANVEPVPLVTVEVRAGRTTWVDLTDVRRPITIRGRVIGAQGPLAGARVRLSPFALLTDAEGRFESSRSFPLTGGFGGVQVRVTTAGVETRFQVPPMDPAETRAEWELVLGNESVRLLVLDANGDPASASVELGADLADEPRNGIVAVNARDLAIDGSGSVLGLPPGEYGAKARFRGGAEAHASFRLPASGEIVLRAPRTGDVAVRLTFADGRPAVDWRVLVGTWTGAGPAPADADAFLEQAVWKDARTDEQGRARIHAVQAGELQILSSQDGWGARANRSVERASLRAGEELALELTAESAAPAR